MLPVTYSETPRKGVVSVDPILTPFFLEGEAKDLDRRRKAFLRKATSSLFMDGASIRIGEYTWDEFFRLYFPGDEPPVNLPVLHFSFWGVSVLVPESVAPWWGFDGKTKYWVAE